MLGDLLSPLHIALLLIVALLIFGPRRLPELGGAVGKTIKEFQKSMNEARAQISSATALTDSTPAVESAQAQVASVEKDKPN